ncbi:hypothetical protein YC2023_033117 [Brassica napus]
MVPPLDAQGPPVVVRTINYRSGGIQGPTLESGPSIADPKVHAIFTTDRQRRSSNMLRDDGDRRKRRYIHSFRIFQPQPSRGKRRILTRSKPHKAGNTSSREENTTLNKSNKTQHRNYQLVPTSSYWFWVLSSDQTFCSPWFLLVPGPILISDFLQSLVPTDFGPWFLLVSGPILISDPRSLRICRFRVPTQSRCLQLLTPAGSGSSLHNKSQQPSDPMGAAITKQVLDDIHTSRLTTPPHMRKMQGSQAGHNIFRPGSGFTTWTNSKDRRSQTKSSWKYHGRTKQPLLGNNISVLFLPASRQDSYPQIPSKWVPRVPP